jgi:bisphosphoglycerate-independent phosphoglycerate mutase (AlkP superfamily)
MYLADALYGRHAARGQVAFLDACERDVGLPSGQIGNSEVGHMNIGAGRVVWQDICAIDNAIADGTLSDAEALKGHIAALQASGGTSVRGARVQHDSGIVNRFR